MVAGVATNGVHVYIVGGQAHAYYDPETSLLLADIWEFHAHECCWIQVFPFRYSAFMEKQVLVSCLSFGIVEKPWLLEGIRHTSPTHLAYSA